MSVETTLVDTVINKDRPRARSTTWFQSRAPDIVRLMSVDIPVDGTIEHVMVGNRVVVGVAVDSKTLRQLLELVSVHVQPGMDVTVYFRHAVDVDESFEVVFCYRPVPRIQIENKTSFV